MKTEAKVGVMLSEAKECLKTPGSGRDKEASTLGPSEGVWVCFSLGFGLLVSKTFRE